MVADECPCQACAIHRDKSAGLPLLSVGNRHDFVVLPHLAFTRYACAAIAGALRIVTGL